MTYNINKVQVLRGELVRQIGIALMLLAMTLPALGHEQKAALTRVLFNETSGNLEVMHRLYLHDAEHAARLVFNESVDIIASVESRELFASYVCNRFAITGADEDGTSVPLPLEYVGQELEGRFVWVYQEIPLPADLAELDVFSSVLVDVWPDQSNLINIERDGQIYSLSLSGENVSGSVNLSSP